MKPSAAAARAAASISARVALRRPKPMFSATVAESSTNSWLTTAIWSRSEARVSERMSWPSIRMRPAVGS